MMRRGGGGGGGGDDEPPSKQERGATCWREVAARTSLSLRAPPRRFVVAKTKSTLHTTRCDRKRARHHEKTTGHLCSPARGWDSTATATATSRTQPSRRRASRRARAPTRWSLPPPTPRTPPARTARRRQRKHAAASSTTTTTTTTHLTRTFGASPPPPRNSKTGATWPQTRIFSSTPTIITTATPRRRRRLLTRWRVTSPRWRRGLHFSLVHSLDSRREPLDCSVHVLLLHDYYGCRIRRRRCRHLFRHWMSVERLKTVSTSERGFQHV